MAPPSSQPELLDGDGPRASATAPPELGVLPISPRVRERLRAMFEAHYELVWRVLRRSGLQRIEADDAAQQAFMVAARRIDEVAATTERAFLCATALKIASRLRQTSAREVLMDEPPEPTDAATPLEALEHKRRRELLDRLLRAMDEDLRIVLVLSDIEGLSKREVAEVLGVPEGTAASRLRRARDDIQSRLQRERGAR